MTVPEYLYSADNSGGDQISNMRTYNQGNGHFNCCVAEFHFNRQHTLLLLCAA